MSLADVVNRIAQGTQAGKQAIASGASNAEARQAARQAAGVQVPPGRIAMETKADRQFAREQAKADATKKQAQQIVAPGSQDVSSAFSGSDEELSAFDKPDESKKKKEKVSHDYDALRDWGGVVPIIGPALSLIGSTANMLSSEYEDTPNATSNAREAVESGDYIADPNSLAMPTASDINTSFTSDEARNQYLRNAAAPIDSFLAEAFAPGIGSAISKALSKPAKAAARESSRTSEGFQNLMDMAVGDAVKNADAIGLANSKAISQEANEAAKNYVNDLIGNMPKDIQDYVANMPYTTRLGKAAGAKQAAKLMPTAQAFARDAQLAKNSADLMSGVSRGIGEAIPRVLRGLKTQTEDFQDANNNGAGGENGGGSNGSSGVKNGTDGIGPKGGKNRSQMQEYYDWLESGMLDPSDARYNAEAAAFIDMYGDLADRDLGYSRLRASGNSDAWGYLLGLQGNQGVDNWRNRYALSGVDFSDEATALNNLMDYLYGDGSINIFDYMTNPYSTIQLANDADAIGQMARWLFSEYNYSPETAWMAEKGLDANDIAMQAIARQVTNNGWGGIDIDQVNDLLAASGDRSKFALVDEDSDEFKNSAWRQQNVVNNGDIKKYGSLMSDVYNPYKDYGLIDADLSAAMMAAYNADPRHSKRLALV